MVARAPQIETVINNFTPRFITSGVPLADFQEATNGLINWEDWLPRWSARAEAVSYTHLTLPTIYAV